MNKCKEILNKYNIPNYYIEGHETVVDYEAAKRVDEKYGLTGLESKCLMLKTKSNKMVLFVTKIGTKMDKKFFIELLNEKTNICSSDELFDYSGYVAGCASPFAYPDDLLYVVDNSIFESEKYICSAGDPHESFEIETKYLKTIYDLLKVNVKYIDYNVE